MRWLALVTGFIIGFVAVKYFLDMRHAAEEAPISNRPNPARRSQALSNMQELVKALEQFRIDMNSYPTTEQDLNALRTAPANAKDWRGPYLSKPVPLDPWGNDYEYESDGRSFTIASYGADGLEGGEGEAEDVVETSD
jgi:general secretion pathway protein G